MPDASPQQSAKVPLNRLLCGGCYRILYKIGAGGQGKVYEAECVSARHGVEVGAVVAIKVLDRQLSSEKALERLRKKNERLQQLVTPGIVRYLDFFVDEWDGDGEELGCIVTEILRGQDLKLHVRGGRQEATPVPLPWARMKAIFGPCLEGLSCACAHGVVHRDLKPSNIFITTDGAVKLVDFDIAHFEAGTDSSTAGAKGTLDYMAPEVLLAKPGVDHEQADVFSFGVCFYEALTGELPFPTMEGGYPPYIARWMAPQAPDIPFSHKVFRVYPEARRFVKQCLAVSPQQRYRRFSEVLAAFKAIEPRTIRHPNGHVYYECEEWIGRGGFAEVFKGRRVDRWSGETKAVAVKYLVSDKDCPERFIREAKLIKDHPHGHLVEYIDFLAVPRGDDGQAYYLILEYLEGMPGFTLRGRIEEARRTNVGLPLDEIVRFFVEYLEVLSHLHDRGICHRDIKPNNLYAPPGHPERAKVFDLGIARDEKGTLTGGFLPGTPDYMAPELAPRVNRSGQWEYKSRGLPQSDLYALALCLYEAVCGVQTFPKLTGKSSDVWIAFIKRAEEPPRPAFNQPVFGHYPALRDVIGKALRGNPKERFKSADEMRKALEAAMPGLFHKAGKEVAFDLADEGQPKTGQTEPGATTRVPSTVYREPARGKGRRAEQGVSVQFIAVAIAVGVVVLVTGGVFGTASLMVERWLGQEAQATSGWVCALARVQKYKPAAVFAGDDRKTEWQGRLAAHVASIPAVFSNAFTEAVTARDTNATALVAKEWQVAQSGLDDLGVAKPLRDGLWAWMSQQDGNLRFDLMAAAISSRMPTSVRWSNLKECDALLDTISYSRQDWANIGSDRKAVLEKLDARLVSGVDSFLKQDATVTEAVHDDIRWDDLKAIETRFPSLASKCRDTLQTAVATVTARRTKMSLHDRVMAVVRQAYAVSNSTAMAPWISQANAVLSDPAITQDDRRRMEGEIADKGRQLVSDYARQAGNAYAEEKMEDGNRFSSEVEAIVKLPVYRKDGAIQNLLATVVNARVAAEKRIAEAMKAWRRLEGKVGQTSHGESAIVDVVREAATTGVGMFAASDAGVKALKERVVAASLNALDSMISRRDDPQGRQARLVAAVSLLGEESVRNFFKDKDEGVREKLDKEMNKAIVRVENRSGHAVSVRFPEGVRTNVAPDGSLTLELAAKATGEKPVVVEPLTAGYVARTGTIRVERGGGDVLALAPFEIASIPVSVAPSPSVAGMPPVRVAYRGHGKSTWSPWPGTTTPLLPGGYEVRFSRDDFADIVAPVELTMGQTKCTVPQPEDAEWAPTEGLAALRNLAAMEERGQWGKLAQTLVEKASPRLVWEAHAARYQQVLEECSRRITAEISGKSADADRMVEEYCAYLYQKSDPPNNKLRRLQEPFRLTLLLPVYPEKLITGMELKAHYARLLVWQEAMEAINKGKDPSPLVAALNRESAKWRSVAPGIAERCQFEANLLGWSVSGESEPPEFPGLAGEMARWRAHSVFKPGQIQPDVLASLARYAGAGGHPDRYDMALALYESSYCWKHYVEEVLKKRTDDYWNPEGTYAKAVKELQMPAMDCRANLMAVLRAGETGEMKAVMTTLQGRTSDPDAVWILALLKMRKLQWPEPIPEIIAGPGVPSLEQSEVKALGDLLEGGRS